MTGQRSMHMDESIEDLDDEDGEEARGSIVSGKSASLKGSGADLLKAKKKKKKPSHNHLDDKVKIHKAIKNTNMAKDASE